MFRSTLAACCGVLVLLALSPVATAAPGGLDPTFGTDGAVLGSFGALIAADRDSAGRSVAVGSASLGSSLEITRRTADGDLDPTFGDGGRVVLPSSSFDPSVSVAADDSVYVGIGRGYTGIDVDVVHLSAAGVPDPAFTAELDGLDPASVLSTPAGLLVLGQGTYPEGLSLLRLTGTGAPDPTFGDGGRATIPLYSGWEYGVFTGPLVAIRPDGSIVAAGMAGTVVAVAALTADGQPLAGFGVAGVAQTPLPTDWWGGITALHVGPSGEIVTLRADAVARMTPSGAADTSFGRNGVRSLDLGAGRATLLAAVTAEADGSVLVAGSIAEDPRPQPVVDEALRMPGRRYYEHFSQAGASPAPERAVTARLTPSGAFDCAYGTYGYRAVTPMAAPGGPELPASASNAALFAPGRTLLLGSAGDAVGGPHEAILAVEDGAGTPPAAAAPVVVNAWTQWSQQFEGWVDPRCGDVTAHFEYGPTTAYGARTPDTPISGAGGPSVVKAYVSPDDLAVGDYHYRLVAEGAAGSAAGPDRTFSIVEMPRKQLPPQPEPPTPTLTTPLPSAKPAIGTLRLRSSRATLRSGRTARLAVRCRGGVCKRTTVTLRTGRTTLATGSVTLASGKDGYVTVRFTAAGRRAAARHRVLRTTALLAVTGGTVVKAAVSITSPKPKKAKRKTAKAKSR